MNSVTDSYPILRIDDCIDKIANAKFVSKFDLLKGYWQVPLTERAKEIPSFVTLDGLLSKVMPFGMKNAYIPKNDSFESKVVSLILTTSS